MTRLFFLTLFGMGLIALSTPAFAVGNLVLTSPLIGEGQTLPRSAAGNTDGCNGQNISPTLDWSGAPKGTRSMAITLYDPDAAGGGWVHWVVTNIPPLPSTIVPDAGNPDKLPPGVNVIPNSFKIKGYSGPCPPPGEIHNYEFTIFAMPEAQVFYTQTVVGPDTIKWLHDHSLESATLTVKYGR